MNLHTKLWITLLLSMIILLSVTALFGQNRAALADLQIKANLEYGSNSTDFIFDRSSPTTFGMKAFDSSNPATLQNYSTAFAAESLVLSFPASGQYQLKAEYHGSTTVTTFSQAMVNGDVHVPLSLATSSSGMDANGNPNADSQNNVLTIVVNPGNSGFESTYTLRFRRRANNPRPVSRTSPTALMPTPVW